MFGHRLAGIHSPAAAHGEDHVRRLHRRQALQHRSVFIRRVAAVPNRFTELEIGAGQSFLQGAVGLGKRGLAADYRRGLAELGNHTVHFFVAVGTHAPGGQAVGVIGEHDASSLFSAGQNKSSFVPKFCFETKLLNTTPRYHSNCTAVKPYPFRLQQALRHLRSLHVRFYLLSRSTAGSEGIAFDSFRFPALSIRRFSVHPVLSAFFVIAFLAF